MIKILVSDIKRALDHECYFVSLGLALTLPDICGKAAYAKLGVGERYRRWCKEFVCEYERPSSPYGDDMPYLNEEILYSLRNCFLHQGTLDIESEKIKEERCKVDKFALILTDIDSINSGTSRVSYGANLRIVEREQTISIRHICNVLCAASLKYYEENRDMFDFISYSIIDERAENIRKFEI